MESLFDWIPAPAGMTNIGESVPYCSGRVACSLWAVVRDTQFIEFVGFIGFVGLRR